MPPAEVSVSKPETREVTDYEDFPGRIEAVDSVEVRARVSGYLEKVHFKEGAMVKKGDLLFEIDARLYEAELARAEGSVVQYEGQLKRLEADYHRVSNLLPSRAANREEFDKIVGDREVASGSLKVVMAERDKANLNLGWTKVRAPVSGRISRKLITPGNMVKADDTALTTIVSLDPVYAYFDLDERTTLRFQRLIRAGKVQWSTDAGLQVFLGLADEKDFPRKGTIDFADNRVDTDTGTWQLRALFNNDDKSLSPGLFVRVRLPIGSAYQALVVSEQALSTDQGQKYVYVVEKAEKTVDGAKRTVDQVAYRRVKVGRLHNGLRVITDGLKGDERVVVSGLQRVRPGAEVAPVLLDHMPVVAEGEPEGSKDRH
jgi:RND family efflux transporter MFP subunit